MGVAGSGKTTVGREVAQRLGWPMRDADAFHPAVNIAKMQRGQPLTDADRGPWLRNMRQAIAQTLAQGGCEVLTCSALKANYRRMLVRPGEPVLVVFLHGSSALLQKRLQARLGHFFQAGMLDSQLAALEPPLRSEALHVEVAGSVSDVAQRVLHAAERPKGCG